ncbi:MAG: hypothetical protein R3C10_01745 [Pirellulales bacterium]
MRRRVEQSLGIAPESVIVNASHCHGIVCTDIEDRTVRAIEQAAQELVPVTVGVGHGHEDRIQENRRLILKDGRQVDVRQAYSLPPDEEVAAIGPIDPEIGVLRLDRTDGGPLAVVYNFACHPIQAAASGGNTADITGFASQVIEDNTGAVALFLQGCGGDINPVMYKDVHFPRDAEPLGNRLGLSTLAAVREVQTTPDDRLTVINEHLDLPRADLGARIIAVEAERERLVDSLQGTYLDLKTFLPLVTKYRLDPAPVVRVAPLSARRSVGPRRLREARRPQSPQHRAVHPQRPHDGAAHPDQHEPGTAAQTPAAEPRSGQPGARRGTGGPARR